PVMVVVQMRVEDLELRLRAVLDHRAGGQQRGGADPYNESGHAPAPRVLSRAVSYTNRAAPDASYCRRQRPRDRGEPSPDAHALAVREIELLGRLHVERVVPAVHVADDAIDPILLRRVGIGDHLLAHRLLPAFHAVTLSAGQEEPLLTGEAVEHRGRLAAQ